jgi:TRAP-type mannitol/chloroaromatic compound transport system substrate-binding protein
MPRKHARLIAVAGLVGSVAAVAALDASAQDRVRWKMQSAFGSTLVHLGPSGIRFAERINEMSGGNFEIKFFEPGALVPALEAFDAVSKGSVDSAWTTPGYHTGKLGGAVSFFTAVPFGPQLGEFLAWKWFGGGQELREELYNTHGATAVDCFCIGPETSGWFKTEITSLEELKGLKMRFFGLGAKVMQKMGVSTQLLAAADIYPALERGVIDATEFSMPTIDLKLGFHQIAKNNYYPGWHQQVSCGEFLMNIAAHDALPNSYKAMIKAAAGEQLTYTYAETEAMNPQAMMEMLEKYGVTNRRWPDDTLRQLEAAWLEVVEEESAADPMFKRIADSFYGFRETYRVWGEAQALDSTYQ